MVEVYRIPIPKEKLQALPEEERVLLLLLGYASNQLLMLQKLLLYATQFEARGDADLHATGVQIQMLVRITVSATFEAWLLIERLFLGSPLAKDYLDRLDSGGRQVLEELKRHFGKSSLLPQIRNNYGFHYPKSSDVEKAFQAAVEDPGFDDMWKVYFSQHGFNSVFLMTDAVFAHGIAAKAGAENLLTLQKRLMDELREVSLNIVQFAQAFFAAAWIKHFGDTIDAQDIVTIEGAPSIDAITLPFFVEVPPPGDRPPDA